MSIEAIGSAVQPSVVKGDGLQNLKSQDASTVYKHATTSAELPAQAVKSVSPAEEEDKLKDAAEKANEFVNAMNLGFQFSVDKDTKQVVCKVVNKQTGELIRQIPSKEMLEIAKALDILQGLIIRKKA